MLAADEDVANKVSKLAQRRGYTVYQTVNEILEIALKSEELGYTLNENEIERGLIRLCFKK